MLLLMLAYRSRKAHMTNDYLQLAGDFALRLVPVLGVWSGINEQERHEKNCRVYRITAKLSERLDGKRSADSHVDQHNTEFARHANSYK